MWTQMWCSSYRLHAFTSQKHQKIRQTESKYTILFFISTTIYLLIFGVWLVLQAFTLTHNLSPTSLFLRWNKFLGHSGYLSLFLHFLGWEELVPWEGQERAVLRYSHKGAGWHSIQLCLEFLSDPGRWAAPGCVWSEPLAQAQEVQRQLGTWSVVASYKSGSENSRFVSGEC